MLFIKVFEDLKELHKHPLLQLIPADLELPLYLGKILTLLTKGSFGMNTFPFRRFVW